MNFEEELSRELQSVAGATQPDEVPLGDLARLGRRERRRRRAVTAGVTTAVAAAAVVAVVAIPGLIGSERSSEPVHPPTNSPTVSTSPTALDDLSVGVVSRVPWWQGGVLHVGDTSIETDDRLLVFAGGTTVVGRSSAETGVDWFLVEGDELTSVVSSDNRFEPVISGDGNVIAWSEPVGDKVRRLAAYGVGSHTDLGSTLVRVDPLCCDAAGELVINGIDRSGRVFFSRLGEGTEMWTPGTSPIPVTGLENEPMNEVWPGGVMFQGVDSEIFDVPGGVYGTVDSQGRFHKVGEVPDDQLGTWSPDGSAYAHPGRADGSERDKEQLDHVWVLDVGTGDHVALNLPSEGEFEILAWESPTALILSTRRSGVDPPAGLVALVRCDTRTGTCEQVEGSPTGNVILPEAR